MAKDKRASGGELPLSQATQRIYKRLIIYTTKGMRVAQSWPQPTKKKPSPAVLEQREEFKKLVQAVKDVTPMQVIGAKDFANDSKYTYRDVLSLLMVGKFVELHNYGAVVSQYNLDILGTETGMIVVRSPDGWIAIPIGGDDEVLLVQGGMPAWGTAPGITELNGDIAAGPGTGTQTATLSLTGVTPGTYLNADIVVDAKGRVIAASDGAVDTGITQLTGEVIAGPGSGTQSAALSSTGVTAGSYTNADITVDAHGRISSAATGSAGGGITQLTGDAAAGPGSGSQAITLANTGVAPGTYPNATVTVDAKGRATAVAAGVGGPGSGLFAPALSLAVPTLASSPWTATPTWGNQGSAAVANSPAGIRLTAPSNGATQSSRGIYFTAPATPYTYTGLISIHNAGVPTGAVGTMFQIGWTDGTKLQVMEIGYDATSPAGFQLVLFTANTLTGTGAAGTGRVMLDGATKAFQVAADATNVYLRLSSNGVDFWTWATILKSTGHLGASGYSNIWFGCRPFSAPFDATLMAFF